MSEDNEPYTHADVVKRELEGRLREGKAREKVEGYTHAELAARGMGSKPISILIGKCPCGFNFATPHGEDDAVSMMQYHVMKIHKSEFPNGLTREEALKDIKEVM